MRDTHVKNMGWAVCDSSSSSWSPTHGVTNDMKITDTNESFQIISTCNQLAIKDWYSVWVTLVTFGRNRASVPKFIWCSMTWWTPSLTMQIKHVCLTCFWVELPFAINSLTQFLWKCYPLLGMSFSLFYASGSLKMREVFGQIWMGKARHVGHESWRGQAGFWW